MWVVGLTGGIGSGKTAASNFFAEQGVTVVDADVVAREVVFPGSPALAEIVEHFGNDVLQADGSLNRASLRQRIFANSSDKDWLNQLLHPAIRERLLQQLQAATSRYVILVAPLLFENGLDAYCQRTLVIDVDEQTQIQRTQQRDQVDAKQVESIMAAQWSRQQRSAAADDVVDNNGSLAQLIAQLKPLHESYLTIAENT
ncbi:dephospho-CoA kinase [Idiomarina xiamenensis]|uniref:Dephospho-CoA kinase n=1 Tax=Idiomarina xiamenensis 10-D-4 TaxID=740709 RepID=K2JPA1_9GAMM|nr:dephospho-CoA kinase [Idiomarina xiamenensis]EKE85321.1 dephospho-CoA kinase [Idiomarina xiamenensis 10-D-4]